MAHWHFEKYDGYSDINASTAAESFLERAVPDLATGIVREGIQNSLDARHEDLPPDEPVRVRLTFAQAGDTADQWLDALQPHLRTPDVGAPYGSECKGTCEVMIFEDFATNGLTGDYAAPYEPGTKNNFVNFLYQEGVTGKRDRQRGSRGVGKIVFTMASRARTFFAYTVRSDQPDAPVLVGKNVLKFRKVDHESYRGAGYFVENWPQRGPREPVSNTEPLADFCHVFHVARQPQEAGLSIVIPFVDSSVTAAAAHRAVIAEYHYAILAGQLQVSIDDHGEITQLDAAHLPPTGDPNLDHQVALARWALSEADAAKLVTKAPQADQPQRLEPELVPTEVRDAISAALNNGERVAVRMPLHVHPKGRAPEQAHFDVVMERAQDYTSTPAFIRELLPISSVHNATRAAHIRALVVINPGSLADLLRAAEGANHTDWSSRTDRFKEHYRGRLGEISFVARSVAALMAIVRDDDEKPVGGIATRFFAATPQNGPTKPGKKNKGKGNDPGGKNSPDPTSTPSGYTVARTNGGFTVHRANRDKAACPEAIKIRVAYDVLRGSPWRQWDPADFDVRKDPGNIKIESMHAAVHPVEDAGNRIIVKPDADRFAVSVTGFDPNRDLIIDHHAETGGK